MGFWIQPASTLPSSETDGRRMHIVAAVQKPTARLATRR
jgi:hypothetical protein